MFPNLQKVENNWKIWNPHNLSEENRVKEIMVINLHQRAQLIKTSSIRNMTITVLRIIIASQVWKDWIVRAVTLLM